MNHLWMVPLVFLCLFLAGWALAWLADRVLLRRVREDTNRRLRRMNAAIGDGNYTVVYDSQEEVERLQRKLERLQRQHRKASLHYRDHKVAIATQKARIFDLQLSLEIESTKLARAQDEANNLKLLLNSVRRLLGTSAHEGKR